MILYCKFFFILITRYQIILQNLIAMKVKPYLLAALLALTSFLNCSDDNDNQPACDGDCIIMSVNGETWESTQATIIKTDLGLPALLYYSIDGVRITPRIESISITIDDDLFVEGEHPIDFINGLTVAQFTSLLGVDAENWAALSGSISIDEKDETNLRVKGTFAFELEDADENTLSITDGYFNISYPE